MKHYKYQPLKKNRIYSSSEAAKLIGICVKTFRSWQDKGLKPIIGAINPILFKGEEVNSFLEKRNRNQKQKLKGNQFYCVKCRTPQKSEIEKIRAEILPQFLSEANHKSVIYGFCTSCGTELNLFSSERIVKKWINQGWIFKENVELRYNGNNCSLNFQSKNNSLCMENEV